MTEETKLDKWLDNFRAVTDNGRFYICGRDIARMIGRDNPTTVTRTIPEELRYSLALHTPKGMRDYVFVDESMAYTMLLEGRGRESRRFRDCIAAEILPAYKGWDSIPDRFFRYASILKTEKRKGEKRNG